MVDKNAVRRGYDDVAEAYAEARDDEGRDVDLLADFLRRLPASARLLDVGCGDGTSVLARAPENAAVGIDISRTQLERAAETVPGVPLAQADMTSLPVCDGTVDAITAYHSLIHVPIDDHRSVVEEFARVLRPGGRVLLSEGPDEWQGTNPDWLESGVEM
jgi:ubiquinone/menaquinone biosynthesis C-methylase UbiE